MYENVCVNVLADPPVAQYCLTMSETLPLFPLGTVLFPGLLLPLHIFEDRYRQLVRDLLDRPEPRQFGVIAIRQGRETGVDGIQALHEIGCTATLRQVQPLEDGRYDVVTVGTQRFRLAGLDDSKPYLQGQVDLLTEETGDEAAAAQAARVVRDGFRAYLGALAERGITQISAPQLPEDPATLSYLVAASMIIELSDRQTLLAEPDALHRLTAERTLLSRELTMLRTLTATPAPDLRNSPYSSN
jgi:Lon protease-like protein